VGVQIKIDVIQQHFEQIKQQADSVVVEGAGGWLVPINQTLMLADITVRLDLPVVLVVGIRLGCINHALLTVESIKQRGLSLYGWVANHVVDCAESAAIIATLKTAISSPCLGVVPVLAEKEAITTIRLLA
jgi:dethiobiotin synthetase